MVSGIGGGCFAPNSNVTREQTAVILFNYAHSCGYDVGAVSYTHLTLPTNSLV